MKNAACRPAKKIAAAYRARVDAPSFSGEIDKELYTEHDAAFMDEIEMFFTAALSD